MVKLSCLYPNTGKFDMEYYLNIHMPRSIELLSKGKGYRGVSVERGLGGATPGSAPSYVAMCHYLFDTADDFMAAFMPHAAELQGDVQNYTDIETILQISEVAINDPEIVQFKNHSALQPRLVELEPFTISGVSVRTQNSDEGEPSKAKIANLWGQFFSRDLANKIPGKVAWSPVYGVYSAYESDASGQYTASVGVAVSKSSPEFDTVEIGGGRYLVFEVRGSIPQVVIEAWRKIWPYFETSKEYKRRFSADFELYRAADTVEIHIAIE